MASKMMQSSKSLPRQLRHAAHKQGEQSFASVSRMSRMTVSSVTAPSLTTPQFEDFLFVNMTQQKDASSKFPMHLMPVVHSSPTTSVATPLMQVEHNVFAKRESINAAMMQFTMGLLESGKLKRGGTLCVCTSGKAGRALLDVQQQLDARGIEIQVKIFMPHSYLSRDVPSTIANTEGMVTVRGDRESPFYVIPHLGELSRFLHGLDGEFKEVREKMNQLAEEHGWATLDEHFDTDNVVAYKSTADEIMRQLPSVTDVVCTTGADDAAEGLCQYLPAHVNVHARPTNPNCVDGIKPMHHNLCQTSLLQDFQRRSKEQYLVTAGASYSLAKKIAERNPEAHVVFICAEGITTKASSYSSQVVGYSEGEP